MNIIKKDASIENTDDDGPGSFQVILSAPTKDRDGDTLLPGDWKTPLPDHITFDMDHGMTVASTVGSGVPHLDGKGRLIVDGTYSSLPRAQEVRTLVREGHIKTTSVAFMSEPATQKDGSTRTVRELLNGAFVAIPSNREALVLASKALDLKAGARNSQSDAAMIQQIHDHAIALGAKPADPVDTEAAKALLLDVDPATLPEAVQKALGLLIPDLHQTGTKATRPAELDATAQALASTDADTLAADADEIHVRAARYRALSNLNDTPERG